MWMHATSMNDNHEASSMSTIHQGSITLSFSDDIKLPDGAGQQSSKDLARTAKARRNSGSVGQITGQTLKDNVSRISVPGLDLDELIQLAASADAMNQVISELETLANTFRQGNLMLDSQVHLMLARVIRYVRAGEKDDPQLPGLFTDLVKYFSNARKTTPTAATSAPTG